MCYNRIYVSRLVVICIGLFHYGSGAKFIMGHHLFIKNLRQFNVTHSAFADFFPNLLCQPTSYSMVELHRM